MISVTDDIHIDEGELKFEFIHSSGPGGQNINKVATAVQLRFDVRNSPSLPPEIKERLIKLAGARMTENGVLIIEAKRFRTREQNREDAIRRLMVLIQKAAEKPKIRKKTKPTVIATAARVDEKKRRGAIKRIRGFTPGDWDK